MSPRNTRLSTSSSSSRSLERMSNPNVFSDEYALEPLESHDISPIDADNDQSPSTASSSLHTAPSISRPISPEPAPAASTQPPLISYQPFGLRDVTSSTPNRAASRASNTFSDMHRASSTSSHFSMPRSQSPYVGATGPSHPYGMYPQITRASSIASGSTLRPIERPFVAPGGPGHPYAMYSQNTVPEEDDVSLAPPTIPLGFPGMGGEYQRGTETRRDDIADIVGSDGHVEELPPYTRYADEVAAKEIPPSNPAAPESTAVPPVPVMATQPSHNQHPEHGAELNSAASRNARSDSSGSFKEKIRQKSKQRICCGLPFWFIFVITGVLLFGVILGAIIGGVVGSKKGTSSNATPDALEDPPAATATVISTAFIDGAPLPTDHPIPPVPNGEFNVPINNSGLVSQGCIQDPNLSKAWSCMPPTGIGLSVTGQRWDAKLTVDPYPLNGPIMYGAQPPDLGSQPLSLAPSMDRDSDDLGPSLFAWTTYDKLTILREEELPPSGQTKRDHSQKYARAVERPWFCWFNQTVLEFFIYVNRYVESSPTTPAQNPSYPPAAPSTLTTFPSTTFPWSGPASVITSSAKHPMRSFDENDPHVPFFSTSDHNERRDYDGDDDRRRNNYRNYPLQVKIEEKRKPNGNIRPYCQQMQILNNGEIVKVEDVATIQVPEDGSMDASASERLRRRDSTADLNQNCACEWITG